MKLVKVISVALLLIGAYIYMIFPRIDAEVDYWETAWWQKSIYDFCKYQIPENYKAVTYVEAHGKDKNLVVLRNEDARNLIIVARLRGFHYVPLEKIEIGGKNFSQPLSIAQSKVTNEFNIIVYRHLLYFLEQGDLNKIPDNLALKGLVVEKSEKYSTQNANVYYISGTFQKIGFFKKMPFPWGFANPIFDFLIPSKGALAILNSKNSNETLMIVSQVPNAGIFNEDIFKKFIASVSFDKEPFVPYRPGNPTTKIKSDLKIG